MEGFYFFFIRVFSKPLISLQRPQSLLGEVIAKSTVLSIMFPPEWLKCIDGPHSGGCGCKYRRLEADYGRIEIFFSLLNEIQDFIEVQRLVKYAESAFL